MNSLVKRIAMMDEAIGQVGARIPAMPQAEVTLLRMLLMVGMRMQDKFASKLKPHGINDSEFHVLVSLFGHPDGSSTPGELCECADQGATNMTRIADALVKRGMVARAASREDRRRVVIRLTATGRRFVQSMLPTMFPQVSNVFGGFSVRDKQTMSRLLRAFAKNLDALEAHAGA